MNRNRNGRTAGAKVSNSTLGGSCETCSFVSSGSAGLSGQFLVVLGKRSTDLSWLSFRILWKRIRCEKAMGVRRKGREERKSGRKAEKQ